MTFEIIVGDGLNSGYRTGKESELIGEAIKVKNRMNRESVVNYRVERVKSQGAR